MFCVIFMSNGISDSPRGRAIRVCYKRNSIQYQTCVSGIRSGGFRNPGGTLKTNREGTVSAHKTFVRPPERREMSWRTVLG